jgi:hypothetical protein
VQEPVSTPPLTTHVAPRFGLPYAAAAFDDDGYHVVCPVCGWKARAESGRSEDDVTDAAALAYAGHFAAMEKAGR